MIFFELAEAEPGSTEDRSGRIDVLKEANGVNRGSAPSCPSCGRFLGLLSWLPPFRIELETWGRHYGDIARTGDDLIVSERLMNAVSNSRIQGLMNFAPVEVVKVINRRGKPKESLPRYFKATIARSSTTIDQDLSGYVWEDDSKICPECLFGKLKRHSSFIIKDDTWNGDDVFFPRGGNGIIVTERFKKVVEENGLTGARFIPVEEAGHDNSQGG